MRRATAAEGLDLVTAAAAGPSYWGWRGTSAADVAACLTALVLLATVASSATAGVVAQAPPAAPAAAAIAGTWLAALGWWGLGAVLGRRIPSLSLTVVLRLAAVVALSGLWGATHDGSLRMLELWPLGAAVGLESSVTMAALGVRVRPRRLLAGFLSSAVHAGLVVALLGLAAAGFGGLGARTAFGLYLAVVANVAAGIVAMLGAGKVRQAAEHAAKGWKVEEARRRANWIHDDVCGLLIPLRQSIRSGLLTDPAEIRARLDDVDFELRRMQLAEAVAAHTPVSLADLIQLWARRAQAAGVELHGPPWERSRRTLADADRLAATRTLGVAVPNAMAAKASTVTVSADERPDGSVVLSVTDDAGGFDTTRLPPARGLARLIAEFGDRVEVRADELGATVTVVLGGGAA